jgi:putative hemolysin
VADLFLVLLLTMLNAVFAMSEIAIVSSKRIRLQQLVDKGSKGAKMAIALQDQPGRFLSAVQVGITSIAIVSGIVGEKSLVSPLAEFIVQFGLSEKLALNISSVCVIVLLTFLSVVFGELIPKTIGMARAEFIASKVSIFLNIIATLFFPIIWVFSKTSGLFLKLLGLSNLKQAPISNEEIKQLMQEGSEAGVFHEEESKLVANVLHMDEKSASSIMTSRSEIEFIDVNDSLENIKEKVIACKYSRVPVVDGGIENILGFVEISTILKAICSSKDLDIKEHMETPLFLPMTVSAVKVFEEMRKNRREVVVIINEFSEVWGIVTVNDIIESIMGEIDMYETETDKEIFKREDGSYLVDGLISLDRLREELSLEDELYKYNSSGVSSLNGFILGEVGRVPTVGTILKIEIQNGSLSLEIVDMDKNCVDKVLLKIEKNEDTESAELNS